MEKGIKIKIDYENAVVNINKLEIAFKDLGKTAESVSKSISYALRGDDENFAGSEKRLRRQVAAMREVQSSLSTTNKQYRIYQAEIDKVMAKLYKLTNIRKREETAIKGSAAAIQKEIAALKMEQKNRAKSNSGYRAAERRINKLTQELEKLTNVKKKEEIAVKGSAAAIRKEIEALKMAQDNTTKSNKSYRQAEEQIQRLTTQLEELTNTQQDYEVVQEGSIAAIDRQIAVFKQYQRNVATTTEKIEELQEQINKLEADKQALAGTTGNLARANDSYSSSAGIAGSTATEFGRILADMPYGLQGVANNIEQFTQQFVDLQRKSGGFKGALQSLGSTIMGPAGIVVAVQAFTMTLQFLKTKSDEAKSSIEELDTTLVTSTSRLEMIIDRFSDVNLSEERRAQLLKASGALTQEELDLLKEKHITEKELFDLINMRAALQNQQILNTKREKEVTEELKELKVEQTKLEADMDGAAQDYLDKQNRIIMVANAMQENQIPLMKIDEARNKIQEEYEERQKRINELNNEALGQETQKVSTQEAIDAILAKAEGRRKKAEEDAKGKGKEDDPKKPGTIAYFEELISKLQEQQEEVATTSEAYDEIAKQIVAYEHKIENITKEKERQRQEELKELRLDYTQEALKETEEGELEKLRIQEDIAIQEATKLKATRDDMLLIEEVFEKRREEIRQKYRDKNDKNLEDAKKDAVTSIKEKYKVEIDAMKMAMEQLSSVLTNFGAVLDELGQMSQHRYERQINNINSEKELVKQNENLSIQEKESALTFLQQRENEVQKKRIKAERDMFTIKQTIMLSEMILKQRMMVQEQILLAKQNVLIAKVNGERTMQGVAITAAEQVGKAGMSIGEFMRQLGPWGIAAFALSIGGVIASIISARKKAQAEIAGLSNAPVKLGRGGGSTGSSPIFNVVGATSQNQLAETISDAQSRPVRAYVVSNEVTTAQGLERNILEGASI